MSAIVAIPARLKSTRFPRKVLADIHGRSMLWHVYQGVSKARHISDVWVLTDSQEVLNEAASWGAKAMMTSEECPSGTARIASVANALDADIIVNVQADEPLITSAVVDAVVAALEGSDADMATPIYRIQNIEEVTNPNVVKVVLASDGTALYFSRSPIPHVRDYQVEEWLSLAPFWGHVGVYAFRRAVLGEYLQLPEGQLEQAEKLEQLRLLEAGKRILAVEIDYHPHAVDVPSDLEVVRSLMTMRSRADGR
jgi:3-deoxy-manno-octulosonate cytidylyltransferase (CMP-KDO synthetase)